MRLRYVIPLLASFLVSVAAGIVLTGNAPAITAKPEPKARYWTNARVLDEFAPRFQRFSGGGLGLPGFQCDAFSTQRYERVVIVCLG